MADLKRGELEIRLEFECNCFDHRKNDSEGSFKSEKDTQVIRVQGVVVLLLHTNCDIVGWKSFAIP